MVTNHAGKSRFSSADLGGKMQAFCDKYLDNADSAPVSGHEIESHFRSIVGNFSDIWVERGPVEALGYVSRSFDKLDRGRINQCFSGERPRFERGVFEFIVKIASGRNTNGDFMKSSEKILGRLPELPVYPLHGGALKDRISDSQRLFAKYGRTFNGIEKGIHAAFEAPEAQSNAASFLTAVSLYGDAKLSEEGKKQVAACLT